jgi:hypothetical protein
MVKHSGKQGSFGGHFDELVKHFPHDEDNQGGTRRVGSRELQEKRDIHALLFEQAWRLDRESGGDVR